MHFLSLQDFQNRTRLQDKILDKSCDRERFVDEHVDGVRAFFGVDTQGS